MSLPKETVRRVRNKDAEKRIRELINEGYRYRCIRCNTVYERIPESWCRSYSCAGGYIPECKRCGGDLIEPLEDTLKRGIFSIESNAPVLINGVPTRVFKSYNFKYCKCENGELHTGDAETECSMKFGLSDKFENYYRWARFHCEQGGCDIILLRPTEEEYKEHEEEYMGSKWFGFGSMVKWLT